MKKALSLLLTAVLSCPGATSAVGHGIETFGVASVAVSCQGLAMPPFGSRRHIIPGSVTKTFSNEFKHSPETQLVLHAPIPSHSKDFLMDLLSHGKLPVDMKLIENVIHLLVDKRLSGTGFEEVMTILGKANIYKLLARMVLFDKNTTAAITELIGMRLLTSDPDDPSNQYEFIQFGEEIYSTLTRTSRRITMAEHDGIVRNPHSGLYYIIETKSRGSIRDISQIQHKLFLLDKVLARHGGLPVQGGHMLIPTPEIGGLIYILRNYLSRYTDENLVRAQADFLLRANEGLTGLLLKEVVAFPHDVFFHKTGKGILSDHTGRSFEKNSFDPLTQQELDELRDLHRSIRELRASL